MNGTATDVIVARAREVDRLSTMMFWSLGAHIVVMAFLVVVPHPQGDLTQEEPMMISLGGAPGPRTGMTQMAARNVQAPRPETVKNDTAPAPVAKEMTLPDPRSKPPQARPKDAPKEAIAKTVSTGDVVQEGQARAETRVRGQGFAGLSSGGGGGVGGVTVDAPNFCCPEYVTTMAEMVKRAWNDKQNITGVTTMMFTIMRDGRIENIKVEKSSGFVQLDNEAARALRNVRLLGLPEKYSNPTLTVHLQFEYQKQ